MSSSRGRSHKLNLRSLLLTVLGTVFSVLFFLLIANVSHADNLPIAPSSKPRPEAEKIVKDFEKTKQKVNEQDVRQRQVMSSLFTINKRMKSLVREKSSLEQEHTTLEASNRELAKKIIDLSSLVKGQKTILRSRLALISRMSGQGLARILFSSSSSSDLERNLKILGLIAKSDMNLIKDYYKSVEQLQKRKQKLNFRIQHLKKLGIEISSKEASLVSDNLEKSKLLSKIRRTHEANLDKLKQLRQKSKDFANSEDPELFDLLYRPSFYEAKGQLPKPVDGKLRRGYGVVRDGKYNLSWLHKGQYYSTEMNKDVKAVFDGKVAFVGDLPGYGYSLILDHGDHFYSVYAGVDKIQVIEGNEVKQQEHLAIAGRNFFEEGNGVYFEIRHFSEPVDPQGWVKGSQL